MRAGRGREEDAIRNIVGENGSGSGVEKGCRVSCDGGDAADGVDNRRFD